MKVRTYGRRNKLLQTTDAIFLQDPPPPISTKTSEEKRPLVEKSHNAGPRPSAPSSSRKKISVDVFETPAKNVQGPQIIDAHKTTTAAIEDGSRSAPRASNRSQYRHGRPLCSSPLAPEVDHSSRKDDDLSAALADLSLASIHKPQHQRSARSPIEARRLREHASEITPSTRRYLDPIMNCKNVSKCVEDFQGWMDERDGLLDIAKIGEGSFGEVYRARGRRDTVILKLMPLNAQKGKGSRSFTSVSSARNEIKLLGRMSKVPGFVEFRGACVLQGRMASQLVQQWDKYARSGRTVESRNPSKKDSYPATQLWLLIEMSDAGESLERGRYVPPGACRSPTSNSKTPYLPLQLTWDIFWQIVKALAKGEVFAMYEHRDLHLGNICVKEREPARVRDDKCCASPSIRDCRSDARKISRIFGINTSGIDVTLIDYSLSRASISAKETLAYDFKNDKVLLRGKGDLQYDMYRHMATVLGQRASSEFVPQTNVMWMYYVLELLLGATMQDCSAAETDMLGILADLRDQLHPDRCAEWCWQSAGDLLQTGIQENWFLPEHIIDM